jgi:hypothetical protein
MKLTKFLPQGHGGLLVKGQELKRVSPLGQAAPSGPAAGPRIQTIRIASFWQWGAQ